MATNKTCESVHQLYKSLVVTHESFVIRTRGDIQKDQLKEALDLRESAERIETEIKEIIDPYDVKLRDEIAQKHHFKSLTAFTSEGTAVGFELRSPPVFNFVDKKGNSIARRELSWFQQQIGDRYDLKNISLGQTSDDMTLIGLRYMDRKTGSALDGRLFLDAHGNKVGRVFGNARPFSEGKAFVTDEDTGEQIILEKSGHEIKLSRKFSEPTNGDIEFHSDRLLLNTNTPFIASRGIRNYLIYLDGMGKPAFEGKEFVEGSDFSEGVAWVREKANDKVIFIDANGQNIFPDTEEFRFDEATRFSDGIACVRQGNEWYILNQNHHKINITKTIEEKGYIEKDDATQDTFFIYVSEGVVSVVFETDYTLYLRPDGSVIGDGTYHHGRPFSEGLAGVTSSEDSDDEGRTTREYWEYIDKDGNRSISRSFEDAGFFVHGVARVVQDGKAFYIDKKGKRVFW